jgi:uncharacterized protein YecT (DUF1311 family)
MRILLTTAFATALAWPASAQAPTNAQYSPSYNRCQERAASTREIVTCISNELAVQDASLNRRYQQTLRSLNPRQQNRLRAAQRAWIAYREANCASYYDEDWGTITQIGTVACRLDMTVTRRQELDCYPGYGEGSEACRSRTRR